MRGCLSRWALPFGITSKARLIRGYRGQFCNFLFSGTLGRWVRASRTPVPK